MKILLKIKFMYYKWVAPHNLYTCRHICKHCPYRKECGAWDTFENDEILKDID